MTAYGILVCPYCDAVLDEAAVENGRCGHCGQVHPSRAQDRERALKELDAAWAEERRHYRLERLNVLRIPVLWRDPSRGYALFSVALGVAWAVFSLARTHEALGGRILVAALSLGTFLLAARLEVHDAHKLAARRDRYRIARAMIADGGELDEHTWPSVTPAEEDASLRSGRAVWLGLFLACLLAVLGARGLMLTRAARTTYVTLGIGDGLIVGLDQLAVVSGIWLLGGLVGAVPLLYVAFRRP